MKMAWMAGALAATLWGGAALAETQSSTDNQQQVEQPSQPTTSQSQQDSWRQSTAPDQNTVTGGTQQGTTQEGQNQSGIGGSASAGTTGAGVAGSAQVQSNAPTQMSNGHYQIQANLPDRGQTLLDCVPAQQNAQVDKDHVLIQQNLSSGQGWFDCTPSNTNVKPMLGTGGAGETNVVEVQREEKTNALSGTTVLLGGGVEGYTGSLASRIAPGPSYGVAIDFRPTDVFGLELAYSGAANELRGKVTNGVNASSGPDVLRNGGRMLLSLGLAATPVQPYLTAGVGINRYDFRGASAIYGFKDDTAGEVPVGLGFRAQAGSFTADLRGLYLVPFEQDIEPGIATSTTINTTTGQVHTGNAGRYQGELRIGATW
jgi:hypothetical protein